MTHGTCVDHWRCLFCTTISPPKSSTGLQNQTLLFYPPALPSSFSIGFMMKLMSSGLHASLRDGPAHPLQPRLGHMDPSSPIEKCLLPPIFYASYHFHLFLLLVATKSRKDTSSNTIMHKIYPPFKGYSSLTPQLLYRIPQRSCRSLIVRHT